MIGMPYWSWVGPDFTMRACPICEWRFKPRDTKDLTPAREHMRERHPDKLKAGA